MATDTSMDSSVYATPPTKGVDYNNNNEMEAIERLAAREAYDEDLENIHATLSKRGSLRKSLSSNSRSNPLPTVNGRRNSFSKEDEKLETSKRGSRLSERRSSHSSRRSAQERERMRSTRSSIDNGDSTSERRRRRGSYKRRGSRTDDMSDDGIGTGSRPVRSKSAIERLLEYNDPGSISPRSSESKPEKKSSMNPLLLGLSKSRDGGKGGRSATKNRSKSRDKQTSSVGREKRHKSAGRASSTPRGKKTRDRSRSKSKSKSRSAKNANDDTPNPRQRLRRRRSSSSQFDRGRSSDRKNGVSRFLRATKSMRTDRSYMTDQQGLSEESHGMPDDFEKIWGKKPTSDDLNQTNTSRGSTSSTGTDTGMGSVSTRDLSTGKLSTHGSPLNRPKKTKLEKIHELYGKCDRLKIELNSMAEERRKCMRELGESRGEVASLQKMVTVHEEQSVKLKAKVAETQDELETTRVEQQKERTELSEAAKALTRVNIDYAKSVDEARLVREKLDGLEGDLAHREGKILSLEKDLETSDENVRQLEADLLYADGQINSLEAEMKKMDREITLYTEAAERDHLQNTNGDGDGDGSNLREAKYEAEKQRLEEREKELDENNSILEKKNRILENERKEFGRLRTQELEEQQRREREFEEKRAREDDNRLRAEETSKKSDEDRIKKEEELHTLLNALEDENVALNGRLKSEQLDSTMKLQNKDKSIAQLQTEMARLANEQKERDSAPDSSPSLLLEIENLRTEAEHRETEFKDVQMKKTELEKQVEDLQNVNMDITTRVSNFEVAMADLKREFENQKRKSLEWQKKTGEWSEKAIVWKQKAENWEKKAKEANSDTASLDGEDAAQVEPQALFLAAAVEKKAASASAATVNGSWRLGRKIFGMASDSEDETQALISKLEGQNILKKNEIKNLKSEMIRMQTSYKEQVYGKAQECEKLQKEKEALELKNENLLKELDLARKLNRTISDSSD